MEKLISMTKLIVSQYEDRMDTPYNDGALVTSDAEKWAKYAFFLSQKLELWMFVPCDLENYPLLPPGSAPIYTHSNKYMREYKKAKERVLFEGFEVKSEIFVHNTLHFYLQIKNVKIMWNFNGIWEFYKEYKTAEDLVKYNLKLTSTAQKQIS